MTTTNDAPAPAPSGSGVRVKPLEWHKPNGGGTLSRADTIIGIARVWTHHEANGAWFWSIENHASGQEANETDAKKMLWATYEHRILSALAGDASPSGEVDDPDKMLERALFANLRVGRTTAGTSNVATNDGRRASVAFAAHEPGQMLRLSPDIAEASALYAHPAPAQAPAEVVEGMRKAVKAAMTICHDKGYGVAMSANAEECFVTALLMTALASPAPATETEGSHG